jgi:hypothetical protein
MPKDTEAIHAGAKSTDLAEGELDTVEESILIHEGHGGAAMQKVPEPDRRNMDLAEGESDTVEESIRIHEQKGDLGGRPAAKKAERRRR